MSWWCKALVVLAVLLAAGLVSDCGASDVSQPPVNDGVPAGGDGGGESEMDSSNGSTGEEEEEQPPLVMVGILARNTAHTLHNFFGYLENLDYPKQRMAIW